MIIGTVQRPIQSGFMSSLPLFVTDRHRIEGFNGLTHDDIVWVISWSSKDTQDEMPPILTLTTKNFLPLFRNKWSPNRKHDVWYVHLLYVCVFPSFVSQADGIKNGIRYQISQQKEFWRIVSSEVELLSANIKHEIVGEYLKYENWKKYKHPINQQGKAVHELASAYDISRDAIREIVVNATGRYPE